ncbi:MAG: cysteine--tRNA ligase [Burkholderiales bacterium]
MLKIYNTLAREKQAFRPIHPEKVGIYVCGMTVYDYCHLGHARVMVVFDMVAKWLRASGHKVNYVRNVTDIDDKIIRRAIENGESISDLTSRFIAAMHEDAEKLGVDAPDHEPRATQYVGQMISMIGTLVDKGLAYAPGNGDVYYSVHDFAGYGKLSGKSLEDLRAGERVEVDPFKRDPLDFVLWKAAKTGEPSWDSPWGPGRPGWHIECSAMSEQLLGEHFDIHGGGQDLQFPHHENEIAQSEGAHGHTFVNYWMHNGFVRVDDEKMSKSLGNFFTVREVLEKFDAEVVRFFILRAHYRSPLNYSDQHLQDAKSSLTRLYTALDGINAENIAIDWEEPHAKRFRQAMDDDFNTPEAISVLFDLANEINKSHSANGAGLLKGLGSVLGLLQRDPRAFLQGGNDIDSSRIEALIQQRMDARKSRNFAESDRIRDELLQSGIILEDGPQGTTWRRA